MQILSESERNTKRIPVKLNKIETFSYFSSKTFVAGAENRHAQR